MDYIWCVFLFISFHALLFFFSSWFAWIFQSVWAYILRAENFLFFIVRMLVSAIEFLICEQFLFDTLLFDCVSVAVVQCRCVSFCLRMFFFVWMAVLFRVSLFDLAIIVVVSFQVPIHRSCKIVRATFVCDDMHYILHNFSQNVRSTPIVFLWEMFNVTECVNSKFYDWFDIKT